MVTPPKDQKQMASSLIWYATLTAFDSEKQNNFSYDKTTAKCGGFAIIIAF